MSVRGEVLFEFAPQGSAVRVTAFHVDTLTEIVLQAPSQLSHYHMEKLALRKLAYVLSRRPVSVANEYRGRGPAI